VRLAATLTATGLLGFLLLEALKILLAPVGVWLLGLVMLLVKIALIGFGLAVTVAVATWVFRRLNRDRVETV
jgi:hypothetical protein